MLNIYHLQRFLIVGLSCWFGCWSLAPAATDCTAVAQIPQSECEALIDFYNSTNGPNWSSHTGWNETNAPCDWEGVGCENGHVIEIGLEFNQLSGKLPESLGNLSNLVNVWLSYNQLSGKLPESLGNLSNLEILTLFDNQLSGKLPESWGNLSNLGLLALAGNQLSGAIPASWGNLGNLIALWLDDNQLSGSIPDSLGNLSNLEYLRLSNNELCGDIPLSLMTLSERSWFSISINNNHLTAFDPAMIDWLNTEDPTWATTQTPCPETDTEVEICLVYGVHDDGLNDSQLFTINPENDFETKALGTPHLGYDLEGMDIHPQTKKLYTSSGDDPAAGLAHGYIYEVNKNNGHLIPICHTGLGEVSAISFYPINNISYGCGQMARVCLPLILRRFMEVVAIKQKYLLPMLK